MPGFAAHIGNPALEYRTGRSREVLTRQGVRIKGVDLAPDFVEEGAQSLAGHGFVGHGLWSPQSFGSNWGAQVEASASDMGSHMPSAGESGTSRRSP